MNASSQNEDANARKQDTDTPDTERTHAGDEQIKLFVGGLTGDTTNSILSLILADLKEYFGKFGTVTDAFVVYSNSRYDVTL